MEDGRSTASSCARGVPGASTWRDCCAAGGAFGECARDGGGGGGMARAAIRHSIRSMRASSDSSSFRMASDSASSVSSRSEQPMDGCDEDAELRDKRRRHSEEGCGGEEERVHDPVFLCSSPGPL